MKKTSISIEHFKSYQAIRCKYPGAVVLLKIVSDYSAFQEDAELIQQLTCNSITVLPGIGHTCRFSMDELDSILHKLVKDGYKVAICEPQDNP
jgi:DNA mismatch repair protein MutS